MSKHFIISKEVVKGVVRTEEGFVFEFDKNYKTVKVGNGVYVSFTELKAYVDTLQALAWSLREDIDEAISDEQDNSLPDIVGDDTDHIK